MGDYSTLRAWMGRNAMITPNDGDSFYGRLTGADDGGVSFDLLGIFEERAEGGSKLKASEGNSRIYLPWHQVQFLVSSEDDEEGSVESLEELWRRQGG